MASTMNCKTYTLSCGRCGITEDMIFFRKPGLLGYRCRNDGRVFEGKHGVFGDRPPDKCPVCNGKLKQTNGPLTRS